MNSRLGSLQPQPQMETVPMASKEVTKFESTTMNSTCPQQVMHQSVSCALFDWCYLIYFIIIGIIVWIILWILKPDYVMNNDKGRKGGDRGGNHNDRDNDCDDFNWGHMFGLTIVIALIILVLFWLFKNFHC